MAESFTAALGRYKKTDLSPDNQAHLQRWVDDPRAEEVWQKIKAADEKNKRLLNAECLIEGALAARQVATAFSQRRKWREEYRKKADEMRRLTHFLRRQRPFGMPPFPFGSKLAQMLDDTANYLYRHVELSRKVAGVIRFNRESSREMIFMSMMSNELKDITGRWLDQEVGVITDIAFDSPEAIAVEAVRRTRRERKARMPARKERR